MSLRNAMRIYSNTNKGGIFFEPSTVSPKLIGTCTAEIKSDNPERIVIRRTDQTVSATGEFRPIFSNFNPRRTQNEEGIDLMETLGYTVQQVVDYLNAEFNDFSVNALEFGESINFFRDATNTSIFNSQGDAFDVNAIRAVNNNGSIDIQNYNGTVTYYSDILYELVTINDNSAGNDVDSVVNELNALFTVTAIGGGSETNYITIVLDSGAASDLTLGSSATSSNNLIGYNSGDVEDSYAITFPSTSINDNGEYIRFGWINQSPSSSGTVYLGMVDISSSAYTDFLTSGVDPIKGGGTFKFGFEWTNNSFLNLTNENDGVGEVYQLADLNNSTWESSDEYTNFINGSAEALMRIGINSNGYGILSFFDTSESEWVDIVRTQQLIGSGDYAFIYNPVSGSSPYMGDTGGTFPPTVFSVTESIIQSYYYIESPDDIYHYPLFATQAEAEAYDTEQGGSGQSNVQLFTDDSVSGRQWFAPVTGYSSSANAAPTTPGITWNIINTQADDLFVPTAYTSTTFVFDEGDPFNIQVKPTDATSYTTTVTPTNGATFGAVAGGTTFQGTCPQVLGDNVSNPSDDYTFDVVRSNNFGSSTGVLTIRVLNQTSPSESISGFTHLTASTALPGQNLLGSGSVVVSDETLGDEYRYIIEQAYVETNILPYLIQGGDKYIVGNLNAGADVSTLELSDFDFCIAWEYVNDTSHRINYYRDGVSQYNYVINSKTDAFYDYGIEVQSPDVYVFGCNVGDINNQPSPKYGGMLSNTFHFTASDNTAPLDIHFGNLGTTSSYDIANLAEIITPAPERWIQVSASSPHVLTFNTASTMPTLQAGFTYRLLQGEFEYADRTDATGLQNTDVIRFTDDGVSEYVMTNVTRSGTPGTGSAYFEFTVPQAVPPLWWYTDEDGINLSSSVTLAGSTYTASITGITLEGPSANQTGTNLFDDPNGGVSWGWLSIDEQLSAGERLVLDTDFITDLRDAMPDDSAVFIGLKSDTWSNNYRNNSIANATYAGARFELYKYSSSDFRVIGRITGGSSIGRNFGTNLYGVGLAFEITSDGNDIRMMMRSTDTPFQTYNGGDQVNSTPFDDWNSSYRTSTGNQGFGLTTRDIMLLGDGNISNNPATGPMDSNDVDWTGLTEIPIPTPSVANLTSWTKAIDFSGGSEHTSQNTTNTYYLPMAMASTSQTVSAPSAGNTTTGGHPWACAIVFQPDGNASNQHIWNFGNGANISDKNIYLRLDASGNLYFGWDSGNSGTNECRIGNGFNQANGTSQFWGVYIAHNGTRLSGANASAANLAAAFDIRIMKNNGGTWNTHIGTLSDSSGNRSTTTNWTAGSTGVRMDRNMAGELTIGGRGANRNFHGKVASMVVTTLRNNVAMPTDTEAVLMVTDPVKWVTDYKLGQSFRLSSQSGTDTLNWQISNTGPTGATQVWLMGDGSLDAYPTIRSYSNPNASTSGIAVRQIMNSMVSSDIQTVSIPGLT